MGLTYSTPQTDRVTVNKFENVSKLVDLNLNENEDLLDSLNITELNRANIKEPLPIIGGNYEDSDNAYNSLHGGNRYNYNDDDDSDDNNRNTKFISSKNRFNKYDLFKVINELENKKKVSRNLRGGNLEEDLSKSISNDEAMEQVQKIILKELDKVSNNTNMTGGGDCGCDGSKNFSGGAKKKNAKGKKNNQKLFGGSSSEKVKLETTQSEENSSSSSSSSSEETSNGENREDGLSIFPMNSSDVNSSSAEKALRMTRRRI